MKVDLVIVGAGTHGLFLFNQLKKKYKDIVILEQGTFGAKKINKKDILQKGKKHLGTTTQRAFGVGGNSTLWGGQLAEFTREDIENKKYYWGFNYFELKKLYGRLYKIFSITKLDVSINNNPYLKSFHKSKLQYFFTNWLKEPNFYKYFTKKVPNKNIITEVAIDKINFKNNLATDIEIKIKNKKIKISTKKIIFASGCVENSKLFLNKKNYPWKSNKFIGKYFQDHLGLMIGKVNIIDKKKFSSLFNNGFFKGQRYQPKIKYKFNENLQNLGICGEFKFFSKDDIYLKDLKTSVKDYLNYYKLKDFFKILLNLTSLKFKSFSLIYNYIMFKKIKPFSDIATKFYIQCEQIPMYESKIVKNKKNYILNWKINGSEIELIKRFVNDISDYLVKNKIAKINQSKFKKMSNSKILKNIRDTNHPSGGTIISKNKYCGVVDKNHKVWNTKNIYISGSSLFPKSSFANSTFTSLALSLKLADYLNKNV
jgi:hypothetical protein